MQRRMMGLKLLGWMGLFLAAEVAVEAGAYTSTVNIRVKDRSNRSVAGATVKIGRAAFRTDGNGQVILRGVGAGSYSVSAYRVGIGSGSANFTVARGKGIPLVNIKLK